MFAFFWFNELVGWGIRITLRIQNSLKGKTSFRERLRKYPSDEVYVSDLRVTEISTIQIHQTSNKINMSIKFWVHEIKVSPERFDIHKMWDVKFLQFNQNDPLHNHMLFDLNLSRLPEPPEQ